MEKLFDQILLLSVSFSLLLVICGIGLALGKLIELTTPINEKKQKELRGELMVIRIRLVKLREELADEARIENKSRITHESVRIREEIRQTERKIREIQRRLGPKKSLGFFM